MAIDADWIAMVSGKDSRAAVLVAREVGWDLPLVTVGDDCPAPGEEESLEHFARHMGRPLRWLRPTVSVLALLRSGVVSLVRGDLYTRASLLAGPAFYQPIDRHEADNPRLGVLWGLRGEESSGRRLNRARRGLVYASTHGHRCQPIADWSALDVHAMLALCDVPLPPWYLCVDEGSDPFWIRTDWWFTAPSGRGWAWLAWWWPTLFEMAADIDPEVRRLA